MIKNLFKEYDIILASASPRRKLLLEELGIKFRVETKNVDESYPPNYPVEKIAKYLSEIKSAAFKTSELSSKSLIITADTTVNLGKTILGKPGNYQSAANMLRNLSGKKHNVITGITLRSIDKRHSFIVETNVYFKKLTNEEIDYYINTYKPFDKAGAYGIQEWIGHVAIRKIEGSYFNVMGLPTHQLYEELLKFTNLDDSYHNKFFLDL